MLCLVPRKVALVKFTVLGLTWKNSANAKDLDFASGKNLMFIQLYAVLLVCSKYLSCTVFVPNPK